jgi:hypothetical protein
VKLRKELEASEEALATATRDKSMIEVETEDAQRENARLNEQLMEMNTAMKTLETDAALETETVQRENERLNQVLKDINSTMEKLRGDTAAAIAEQETLRVTEIEHLNAKMLQLTVERDNLKKTVDHDREQAVVMSQHHVRVDDDSNDDPSREEEMSDGESRALSVDLKERVEKRPLELYTRPGFEDQSQYDGEKARREYRTSSPKTQRSSSALLTKTGSFPSGGTHGSSNSSSTSSLSSSPSAGGARPSSLMSRCNPMFSPEYLHLLVFNWCVCRAGAGGLFSCRAVVGSRLPVLKTSSYSQVHAFHLVLPRPVCIASWKSPKSS